MVVIILIPFVVDVKKSLDAVGETCFLGLIELRVLNVARNTLVPAHLGQAELAKLAAILIVELFEVGVIDVKLLCAHCDGCEGAVGWGNGRKRNGHVHSKDTADQVQRNQDRSQEGNLAKNLIGVRSLRDAVDRNCREVVTVRSGQNLLEMTQVGSHGHNVILDITQVHSNVHAWCDFVVLVASLCETTEDICFSTEKTKESQTILANSANTTQKRVRVILTHDKHLVLDSISFKLNLSDDRAERIDNVVTINVRREKFNLLTSFLGDDILNCQRVNTKGLANALDLFLGSCVDIKPPDTIFLFIRKLEKTSKVLPWEHKVTKIGSVDSRLPCRGEETETIRINGRRLLFSNRPFPLLDGSGSIALGRTLGRTFRRLLVDEVLEVIEINVQVILVVALLDGEADIFLSSFVGREASTIVINARLTTSSMSGLLASETDMSRSRRRAWAKALTESAAATSAWRKITAFFINDGLLKVANSDGRRRDGFRLDLTGTVQAVKGAATRTLNPG
ncbi:hypothetical protein HG530_005871 [Fusarium avenaceum]|nr:hypothetical protein HG530_005871 [Fusarium avenaceum]